MKKIVLLTLFTFFSTLLFAENNTNYINQYREALYYFDNNDYGKSLTFAEDAITKRKEKSDKQISTLKATLSSKAVKAGGDNINNILRILESRNENEAIYIINSHIKIKGLEYFNNSMSELMVYIEKESAYPEAQYLIGQIFQIEGEYEVAETYYLMALDCKEVLDIPDTKYEILYKLSEISKLQNNNDKYETRLLNILVEDVSSNDQSLRKAMLQTIKSNNKNSLEKFFVLYRAEDFKSIRAYSELTDYYLEQNYLDKALLYSTLSVITGFTKIYNVLKERNNEFEYNNLSDFLEEAGRYSDVVEWGINQEYWKSFNLLARICSLNGYNQFSKDLLKVLIKKQPQEYWQKEAVLQLSNIK